MEVYAKYIDPDANNWSTALNTLITSIAAGTAATGTVVDGADYATRADTPFPFDGLLTQDATGSAPKAYLNWLIFDADYQFVDGGYVRLSDTPKEDGSNVDHEKLEADIVTKNAGYRYIYFSNEEESALEVYFDDFNVTQTGVYVAQATDFGVWGDVIREQKANHDDGFLYRYGYQGQYAEKDDETGWNHFELREYDPIIGRFVATDPVGQFWSPYVGMGNDPVSGVDPTGGCTDSNGKPIPCPGEIPEIGNENLIILPELLVESTHLGILDNVDGTTNISIVSQPFPCHPNQFVPIVTESVIDLSPVWNSWIWKRFFPEDRYIVMPDGEILPAVTKLQIDPWIGPIEGAKVLEAIATGERLTAGAARAAAWASGWQESSLTGAIARHAGPNYSSWISDSGKMIFENPLTARQVVVDVHGGYFRIFQPRSFGATKGKYLNLMGNTPVTTTFTKGGIKTIELQGDALKQATHFLFRQ